MSFCTSGYLLHTVPKPRMAHQAIERCVSHRRISLKPYIPLGWIDKSKLFPGQVADLSIPREQFCMTFIWFLYHFR